ncbi:MAG TPA: DUF308 domain-containing protein [Nitrososphaera sp.]
MTSARTKNIKSPSWIRALQIGIGAIAIGLSISAIIYPVITTAATFVAAAIILFLLGIEQVVAGIFLYKESRLTHIGLGGLITILSSLVMAYPLATATVVIWVSAFALLFGGIASIMSGVWSRKRRVYYAADGREAYYVAGRGSRALSIAAGVLAIALSLAIMAIPMFGVELAGVLIGVALLFYGVKLVVSGVYGRGRAVTSAASTDTTAA